MNIFGCYTFSLSILLYFHIEFSLLNDWLKEINSCNIVLINFRTLSNAQKYLIELNLK